jgi:hypothetical protein
MAAGFAHFLRDYGDTNVARQWELAARELDAALEAHGDDTLSLKEASRASGYTADHLGLLVKRGTIPNAGRIGAPRIRRADLPIKEAEGPGRPRRKHLAPGAASLPAK